MSYLLIMNNAMTFEDRESNRRARALSAAGFRQGFKDGVRGETNMYPQNGTTFERGYCEGFAKGQAKRVTR